MVVLVYVRNNIDAAKICINALGRFADGLPIIVVDNASTDGFMDWASTQTNFDFVYMDEGYQPAGAVINQVVEGLSINEDILLVNANYVIAPNFIKVISKAYLSNDNAGAVGCYTNCAYELDTSKVSSYDAAVKYSFEIENQNIVDVHSVMVAGSVDVINYEAFSKVGGFDNRLEELSNCVKDYCLRILEFGYKSYKCYKAVAYDLRGSNGALFELSEEDILRSKWGVHYLGVSPNYTICNMVEADKNASINVLEVGCDCGANLIEIKRRYPNAKVYGAEINPNAVKLLTSVLDGAVESNIEDYKLDFDGVKFDYIFFADVLEHLRNPQGALEFCKSLLKNTGEILASIPNVAHISVIKQLLQGDFTYTEVGLLDKTHIHLFTYNEIVKMFNNAGYAIDKCSRYILDIDEEDRKLIDKLVELSNGTDRHVFESFEYLVSAKQNI